jgi:ABC-2 type transport system permease protein
MLVRHWYGTVRSFDRLTDAFYWITIDLVLWGITAGYMQQHSTDGHNIFFMITASVIMWNVVYRSQTDIGIGLLEELWNKNLVNIFASPLTLTEWVVSMVLVGIIKTVLAISFGSVVAYLLYSFLLPSVIGWYLVPFFVVLVMTGWWIGFLIVAFVLRLTTKAQALAWTFVWILAPMSAIYFPLTSLPPWAQSVASLVPASYVFEEMRRVVAGSDIVWGNLAIASVLNVIYILISIVLVKRSFARVLDRGLVKVY